MIFLSCDCGTGTEINNAFILNLISFYFQFDHGPPVKKDSYFCPVFFIIILFVWDKWKETNPRPPGARSFCKYWVYLLCSAPFPVPVTLTSRLSQTPWPLDIPKKLPLLLRKSAGSSAQVVKKNKWQSSCNSSRSNYLKSAQYRSTDSLTQHKVNVNILRYGPLYGNKHSCVQGNSTLTYLYIC